MWLPLALADILNLLIVTSRRAAGDTGEIKAPRRSEILKSWALPAMAEAVAGDEQEAEAFAMLESVKRLGKENNG